MKKEKSNKGCIGVFDSGFGGLHVLKGIVRKLPQYDYVYLGDTARAPYGPLPQETVYEYAKQAVDFLFQHDCRLILFACNTASSDALHKIQHDYVPKNYPDKKVIGVLIPFAEEAVARTKNKQVGVIATEGTVRSRAFIREITKLDPEVTVFQKACPLLVPLVEAGEHNSSEVARALHEYLDPLMAENIDTLILGCTHYGILEDQIRTIVGPSVEIISEDTVIPDKFENYLRRHPEIEHDLENNASQLFYTTDITGRFEKLGSIFFDRKIEAQTVKIDS